MLGLKAKKCDKTGFFYQQQNKFLCTKFNTTLLNTLLRVVQVCGSKQMNITQTTNKQYS